MNAFPANAGMNRHRHGRAAAETRVPRKRGDEPIIISDAFTANSTFDLGFAYTDGVDVAAVPQDADYFFAALDEAVGLTFKTNTTAPVTLPKDAYLILTNNTAAQAAAGAMNILVYGIMTGTP